MPLLLSVEGLAARRGEDYVFRDITVRLEAGEALVVTGPNGSGKSTFLRAVAGLLKPDLGEVHVSGTHTPVERTAELCHYLGHRNAMKRELTVEENLGFWKSFFGDVAPARGMTITEAAEAVGLPGILHLPYGYLSAGQQRRMAMAKLIVAGRPIWILDEPTAALDAASETLFADLVLRHRSAGGIVLAATHQPLGFEGAKSLVMKGFEPFEEAAW
ncbi:heme exporter protein A [Rhizobium sp. RU20A]|uniref:heme ABC exporter ATP-binding protein CcmA n=1 Tax=Rhizobium sp. RU20A TaxID=1907412 RepID=UPI0009544EC7|nr:heme ABC exporter ATP-binding protein CcmA [Rhizobium sp. RU20A]SIQ88903.1 heme exporter protein A [Rhizobium sp. RU20A]